MTLLTAAPVAADDFSWASATSGSFGSAANWAPAGGPPGTGDSAYFAVGGTYTVSGGGTVSLLQVSGGDVTFTGGISTDNEVVGAAIWLAGGTARVSGSLSSPLAIEMGQSNLGVAGNGTLRVIGGGSVQSSAGPNTNDVAVSMAALATSTATIVIENTDSILTAIGGLNIGGSGMANVEVLAGGELATNGSLSTNSPGIKIAVDAGGIGTLLVDGADAVVNNTLQMNIGQLGLGTFTVTNGGQINTAGTATLPAMVMAFGAGSTGIGYVDAGGTLNTDGEFVIGGGGTAEFYLQPGGSVVSDVIGTTAAVTIANGATSTGTARVNGGTWDVNGDFFLGGQGHGQVHVAAGATLDIANANSLLTIGYQGGGLGELFLNGGQLLRPNTNTVITVGIGGRGRMEIHNGSDVADAKLRMGQIASSTVEPNEVIVEGAGSTLTIKDELDVGMEDPAKLWVQNGATVSTTAVNSFAQAGAGVTGHGEFIVTGADSLLDVAGTMILGRAGRGDLSIADNGRVDSGPATLGLLADGDGNAYVESGGVWNVGGDLIVGDQGEGYLYLGEDGAVSLPSGNRIYLGVGVNALGTLILNGNGLLDSDMDVIVGQNGGGVFGLGDGASYDTVGDFLLGNLSTSNSLVHLSNGSTLTVNGDLNVGVAGDAELMVDSTSTLDASSGSLAIGQIDGSFGQLRVDGGQLLRPADGITTIGFGGRGFLEISGGTIVNDGSIRVAQVPNTDENWSELIVRGTGTMLSLSGGLDLGIEDRGDLSVHSGAQMTVATGLVAGIASVGDGRVSVFGAGSKLDVDGVLVLGWSGISFASVDADGVLESGPATIGRESGSDASIDVLAGGHWDVQGNLIVGDNGLGYVYLREGGEISVQPGSQVILGNGPDGSGIFNIFGNGSLNVDSDVVIGLEGVGALNLFDGASYNSLGNIALGVFAFSSGNVSVNSGSTFTVNGDLTMAEDFDATAGLGVDGAGSVLTATNIHVSGSQVAPGGLASVHVVNQGRIEVADTLNLWPGGTINLAGGGVTVGNNTTLADADAVRVNAQGTLSGSGVVIGNVVNAGGTVAPGNSAGVLAVTGDFTQSAGATLAIEIGGGLVGLGYDRLTVDGAVTLGGTLDVDLIDDFTPVPGDEFQFITAGGVAGNFTSASLPTLSGANWQLEYAANSVSLHVALTGDYNRDGAVNAADYTTWRNMLNQAGIALAADGNNDGMITRLDFDVWNANYGNTLGSGTTRSTSDVPEPGAMLYCLMSSIVLGTLRVPSRRRLLRRM